MQQGDLSSGRDRRRIGSRGALASALREDISFGSPRPDRKLEIDIRGKLFNGNRRYRLALPRDGRLDFAHRMTDQGAISDAALRRDTEAAVRALRQDIESEMTAGA